MRGTSVLRRVGLAVAFGATLVTPTFANTLVGSGWQQVIFTDSNFTPSLPSTNNSTFNNVGSWTTQGVAAYNNAAYTAPGFTAASQWVGASTYDQGGWSIFFFDFSVATPFTASGKFSSDNTSFLFLDNFMNGATLPGGGSIPGSGSGAFSFNLNPATPGFLGYHPAQVPTDPNQNSFQTTSAFNIGPTAAGTHRLWAVVRNDTINQYENNPLAFRLEFDPGSGGGNTNVVPEPFTMALGAAGIGLAIRRRMKKSA